MVTGTPPAVISPAGVEGQGDPVHLGHRAKGRTERPVFFWMWAGGVSNVVWSPSDFFLRGGRYDQAGLQNRRGGRITAAVAFTRLVSSLRPSA